MRTETVPPVSMVHSANWVTAALQEWEVVVPLLWLLNHIGDGIEKQSCRLLQ
jgi:hypothetical protein